MSKVFLRLLVVIILIAGITTAVYFIINQPDENKKLYEDYASLTKTEKYQNFDYLTKEWVNSGTGTPISLVKNDQTLNTHYKLATAIKNQIESNLLLINYAKDVDKTAQKSIAKKIDSAAMMATAKDSISDSISTLVVLGTMVLTYFTNIHIDGWCGLLVAIFVFYAGYSSAKDTISPLLGQPPEPEFVERIEEIIMEYQKQGVLGIHDLVVHNYGPGRVMLSVHVEVPSSGDVLILHDMIDLIEHRLARELGCSAVIHMDPICVDDELTNEMKQRVAEIIEKMTEKITFHDFRIVHGPTHTNIIFDIVIPFEVKRSEEEIVEWLQEEVHAFSTDDMEYFAVIDVDRDMYSSAK